MGVKIAAPSDKEELKNLWKICFHDSDSFIEWFFDHRFIPEFTVCYETEQKIVTAMYAFVLPVKLRNCTVSGAMLCGFSTYPEYRHKGYLGECFRFMMKLLYNTGIVVTVLTPVWENGYDCFEHHSSTNALFLTTNLTTKQIVPLSCEILDITKNFGKLYRCYSLFSHRFSGIISRSMSDMALKCADYASDGAKAMIQKENGEISGYCIFYENDQEIIACETVSPTEQGYTQLIQSIAARYPGKNFSCTMPSFMKQYFPSGVIKAQGNTGLVNVQHLLYFLGRQLPYTIEVIDTMVLENNGIFDFCGKRVQEKPQLTLPAGRLVQFLQGYYSLEELIILDKRVRVFSSEVKNALDNYFPKRNCFIIDSY